MSETMTEQGRKLAFYRGLRDYWQTQIDTLSAELATAKTRNRRENLVRAIHSLHCAMGEVGRMPGHVFDDILAKATGAP